jgi:hypothetical protein
MNRGNLMRKPTKRKIALFAATVVIIGGGAAAYAYWTGTGTGTGSGTTGTSAAITPVQTTTLAPMKPGLAAQTLSGNFTNATTGNVFVTSVTVSIASVVKDGGAAAGTCDATDYTLANATMTVGANEPVGTGVGAWTGATIAFNDKGANQDQCKLATVNLLYTIA